MRPEHPHPGSYATSVDEIIGLFLTRGSHHYDEALSQTEHALQTAALAVRDDAPDPLVAAALLHDVGHLLDLVSAGEGWTHPTNDLEHESFGAKYLSSVFGPEVTAAIALHVRAKRYLAAADPGYADALSEGSVASLARQGGPMSTAEASAFESNPSFAPAVRLRRWDDSGKLDGLEVAGFDTYRNLLVRLAHDASAADVDAPRT